MPTLKQQIFNNLTYITKLENARPTAANVLRLTPDRLFEDCTINVSEDGQQVTLSDIQLTNSSLADGAGFTPNVKKLYNDLVSYSVNELKEHSLNKKIKIQDNEIILSLEIARKLFEVTEISEDSLDKELEAIEDETNDEAAPQPVIELEKQLQMPNTAATEQFYKSIFTCCENFPAKAANYKFENATMSHIQNNRASELLVVNDNKLNIKTFNQATYEVVAEVIKNTKANIFNIRNSSKTEIKQTLDALAMLLPQQQSLRIFIDGVERFTLQEYQEKSLKNEETQQANQPKTP